MGQMLDDRHSLSSDPGTRNAGQRHQSSFQKTVYRTALLMTNRTVTLQVYMERLACMDVNH